MTRAAARIAAVLPDPRERSWFRAPGRVNLVGDHTDYNEGFVLPLAIERVCVVAAKPATTIRMRSLDADGVLEVSADGGTDPASVEPSWGRYVAAVAHELAARGRPAAGVDAVLASDVPLGSGLSSSAALEVACALALAHAAGWGLEPVSVAEACRSAEEMATGVPCGIMDQLASVAGVEGAALLVDCRSLETVPVPLPEELAVLAVHSGVTRALAGSEYAARRRACEALAAKLGLGSLRDATMAQVQHDPFGRHVVTETERVLEVARLLAEGDVERIGTVLSESHASLRDDFRVSIPELDVLVEELVAAGALGARLTGAGFGGSVVAVCERSTVDRVVEHASRRYERRTRRTPTAFTCRAAAGAGRIAPGGASVAA